MKLSEPQVLVYKAIEGLCDNVLVCYQCNISSGEFTIPYSDCYQCPSCYTLHYAPGELFKKWSTSG